MSTAPFVKQAALAQPGPTASLPGWRRQGRVLEGEAVPEEDSAQAYDEMIRRWFWLLNRPFVELACRLLPAAGRVLDVGCGPGWIPIEIARRRPGLEIWAVDPSAGMLELARQKAAAAGVGARIRYFEGRGERLPFEDGGFAACWSHFALHHLKEPGAMLNELGRVVAPGGRVLVKDLRRQRALPKALLLWFSRRVMRYSPLQVARYRDSLEAALTLPEARDIVAGSRLAGARVRGFRGLDYIIIK